MNIKIRNAKIEDMKRVHELIMELALYEKLPKEVDLTTDDLIKDGFGEKKLFNCFVAEINSNVEGMAIVYNRYSTWKGKTIHLEDLIVTKKMRNNGIGALLLDKVILFGKEMGVKRISWEVIDWNIKAIKFYERKGAKLIPDWNIIHLNEEAIKNYH
ncbi:MAG: GNAT family N-acetyltransferase [Flavobacteriales bacterium]|jgi:GNAT superfamily N-acetyltransferase|nr:GNAT family N-acetyltransferase [Flavobacteriaceae bacterium]RZP06803.1 MAG: GNAT family N-acetyltransferase [Flavobacteriales bacterium]|tara:strand:+ start:275 stop:745 length:471 start_codon:yes stop_codon:yes gene_type:complete